VTDAIVDHKVKVHYFDGSKYEGGILDGKKHGWGKTTKGCPNKLIQSKFRNGDRMLKQVMQITYPNGNKYHGHMDAREMKHGQGVMTYTNGEKFDGEWEGDKKCGFGKYLYEDGSIFEGLWVNDQRKDGEGVMKYINRDVYRGQFRLCQRHGVGKNTTRWNETYEGQWYHDKRNDKGKQGYKDGTQYDGTWKMGKMHGTGSKSYSGVGGGKYMGQWVEGQRIGLGSFIFKGGDEYHGHWKLDMKSGHGILKNWNGRVAYDGLWLDDRRASPAQNKHFEDSKSFLLEQKESYALESNTEGKELGKPVC